MSGTARAAGAPSTSRTGSRAKALAGNALTAVIAFAVGLGLAELAVRLVPARDRSFRDTQVHAQHRSARWQPDWRSRRPPGAKAAGVFRILSLGDSFAWGDGVHPEDAYPDRLERQLNRLGGEARFEVVNWSRPGWNSELQWRSVRPAFDSLEPDLVLIGFVLNDAEPSDSTAAHALTGQLSRRSPEHPFSRWLHRSSTLYRLLWEQVENTRQRRAFTAYYHQLYEGRCWRKARRALQALHHHAATRGVPVVLVIFPIFDSQLDERYHYGDLHRTVRQAASRIGIATLDLLPAFDGVDARRLANHPFTDPHPSELAHRMAADRIGPYLQRHGLLAGVSARED